MNKNNRKRQRSENILKLRIPSGGNPEARKTSQIRITKELEKISRNRSCYVRPKQCDVSQITEKPYNEHADAYNSVPSIERCIPKETERNSINAVIPDKNIQIEELEKVIRTDMPEPEIQTCSQYGRYGQNSNNIVWQNVDTIHDIENFLHKTKIEDPIKNSVESSPQNVHISETPKIKTIAEKFSKFKRNNMELRRLDERVVCLEYDIYNQGPVDESAKPIQRMRVFFSIKPDNSEELLKELPLEVKQEFKVLDEDLLNLTEKEIEIIDDNIDANKTYLEDLRRILKQKQLIDIKRNKSSLDLKSLYEMAKRATCCLNNDLSVVNFLSKAELQEIKGLILSQCKSSIHGISRRKINSKDESKLNMGCLSGSIIAELLRENGKIDVFE